MARLMKTTLMTALLAGLMAIGASSANADPVTFTTSGGLGEWETAGLVMNIVPRTGGNTMRGSLFASGTGERLQSGVSRALIEQGVIAGAPYTKVYDISGTLGGAIENRRTEEEPR